MLWKYDDQSRLELWEIEIQLGQAKHVKHEIIC